jgi:hypothetical protein
MLTFKRQFINRKIVHDPIDHGFGDWKLADASFNGDFPQAYQADIALIMRRFKSFVGGFR